MMNLTYLKTVLLSILVPAIAFAQEGNFTLRGKLNKSYNNAVMNLYYLQGKNKISRDVTVKNGAFTIDAMLEEPAMAILKKGQDSVSLFISKGSLVLSTKDSLRNARISGTQLAEDHAELMKRVQPANQEMTSLSAAFKALPKDQQTAKTMEFVDQVKGAYLRKTKVVYDFIAEHPDSYVSLYYLLKFTPQKVNYETTMPHFEILSSRIRQTALGMKLNERLQKAKDAMSGQQYKPFESVTPEGNKLSIDEVLAKGKYTLIDFWASWCGPCRKENPNVVAAYQAYHDKGFNIVSVSLDNDAAKWKAAIAKDGLPWYHVSGLMGWKEPVAQLYGVKAIPQNFLIDNKGVIVATNLREEALLNKLKTLM